MRAWTALAMPNLSYDETTELISLFAAASPADRALASRAVIDRFDVTDDLAHVRLPTLVIHARNDVLHPVAEGRRIAAGIEGAEFLPVDSANTVCLAPDPTWTDQIDAALAFIARR